jgi:alpha-L-fucosidase 2
MTAMPRAHEMTMRGPATRWQDALPTGNGAIGALMFGQIRNDIIILNHESLFAPRGRAELLDVSDKLPELRRLIAEGRYDEAVRLMPDTHTERGGPPAGSTSHLRDPYQPFCDIRLGTSTDGPFRDYRRGVDFATGRTWMRWTDGSGTFVREVFVSRDTDTVFLRIRGESEQKVSCKIGLCETGKGQKGALGWSPPDYELPDFEHRSEDDGVLVFTGRYRDSFAFGAVGQASIIGGQMSATDEGLQVEGADELLFRVKLFVKEAPDVAVARLRDELQGESNGFDEVLAEHAALHGELFTRMGIELESPEQKPNEEMLMDAYDGHAPISLGQTMFEFGRYLLICSSRPGGWPANLQGIWNGDYAPPWNSDFHNDENIQMNYWQALAGNLAETAMPLMDYFESKIDDFRENARKIHGCRGILVPIAMTTHGIDLPRIWSNWTAAAGWLAEHFYDYYLFTGDREFLAKRVVPWLKEVALFYEDFLVEGDDGLLLFNPSISPENRPVGEGMNLLTMNATMDVAVCREALGNLCSACELLGIESDGVERWRAMLDKLPDYEVNEDGAMREWLHPTFKDNYRHRHQSHIYPLFPGLEITEETGPELYEACRVAALKRLVIGLASQSGWSMAHMANIYARLGMGNRALECLEILARSSTGPNLFTYHNDWRDMGLSLTWGGATPPFQIDANFGISAAVLEMLVFSKPGMVKLLPALPDKWTRGSTRGIRCRGGIEVEVAWDVAAKKLDATLIGDTAQEILLKLPSFVDGIAFTPDDVAKPDTLHGPGYWCVSLSQKADIRIRAGGQA